MLKLSRRQIDHEDVVAQGYAALRRAALYLARGDEAEAGDLLHDTFVRFLLLRPRLDAIGNLDGYLYTMLRNVYLSRQRRHVRRKAVVTDAVDVDLLAAMVDEPGPGERLRMRDDLMRLVDHACERTRVSRAASAWILRCVHGYYPAEIARVMKMPSRAVDRSLHVARREALEELQKPARRRRDGSGGGGSAGAGQRWRDLHVDPRQVGGGGDDVGEPLDTLQALRIRLFASVDGACLSDDEVGQLYRPSSGTRGDSEAEADAAADAAADAGASASEPAGTLLMAHVVACAGCLDRINHHLDLPPLKARDPVESNGTRRPRSGGGRGGESGGTGAAGGTIDHKGEGKGSSASRGGAGGAGFDPLLRRTRDTLASIVNHTPRELRIAANGLELGALPVAGVVTVQELAVRLAESLAFVEIFDERGALVCYWPAQVPNDGLLDEDVTIELPDGRLIELSVSLMEDCPRLRVRYTDERLGAAVGLREVDVDRTPPMRMPALTLAVTGDVEELRLLKWWRWFVPSPRVALAFGVLAVLWMILIGPTTTWAAIQELGRAAAEVIRTLISPSAAATPTPAARSAPAAPAPSTSASAPAIAPPRAGSRARVFSPTELSDLEMSVRVALHDVQADLGEDITLSSTPAGVAVNGVVGGAARRHSIAGAIADLDGASVNVRTTDEISARTHVNGTRSLRPSRVSTPSSVPTFTDGGAAAGESPAFANPIQKALAERMPAPADRAAFVNETLARADEALARAWALRRLADRYQARDVTGLSRRSSQALTTLVDDHTAALGAAVDVLIARVTPLVAAAEKIDDASVGVAGSEPRLLSIMEMFTAVNAWHTDAHALLAGARANTITPAAAASTPSAREWLTRLHHIQRALKQPGFGHTTFTPASM